MSEKKYWIQVSVVMLMSAMLVAGCRTRDPADADGVSPVRGVGATDIYGQPLGERFAGDQYLEGQFEPVYYAYDSAQIDAAERAKLESVADYLRQNPQVDLIVEGHCDERGSREYNLALGERRALAARAYLIGLGIESDRLQTKSFGFERPAVDGHDESAWRYNRRAEFVISY